MLCLKITFSTLLATDGAGATVFYGRANTHFQSFRNLYADRSVEFLQNKHIPPFCRLSNNFTIFHAVGIESGSFVIASYIMEIERIMFTAFTICDLTITVEC